MYVLLFGQIWASSFMAKLARPGNQEKRKLLQPAHQYTHFIQKKKKKNPTQLCSNLKLVAFYHYLLKIHPVYVN